MTKVIAYDIGTTGVKTCLFEIGKTITLTAAASCGYDLYTFPDGGAEQDADQWWEAMCKTTKQVIREASIDPSEVCGLSFCSQMQGVILVDKNGVPVRRPMSYMDQRAKEEIKKGIAYGLQIAGANIFKLIPSLVITGAVTSSVKDPVWKYKWIEAHEKDNFSRAYRWLDVKDYLISRCTDRFTMTEDSAFATLIYDTRPSKRCFSKKMCKMFNIKYELLPEIIKSTDTIGPLTNKAADELGLVCGIPVFGGGGDSSLIGIGAGCTKTGSTHIYSGTSGWVSTIVDKQMVDTGAMIAAVTGAQSGKFNYFAEMETAAKCLEWGLDHILKDESGIYVEKHDVSESYESKYTSLFEYVMELIQSVEPGSGGLLFTPWLHGNRCPFEDPLATSMFFGLSLQTTKNQMMRAILEGVFYHLRWMLECQDNKITTSKTIRFVGGGALSPVSCQILSDILGRKIETVKSPQNVGAVGAAAVMAVGLGLIDDLENVSSLIEVSSVYEPDCEKHKVYDKYYKVFKKLYKSNSRIYKDLANGGK